MPAGFTSGMHTCRCLPWRRVLLSAAATSGCHVGCARFQQAGWLLPGTQLGTAEHCKQITLVAEDRCDE